MKKNEKQFNRRTNILKNDLIKLKCEKSPNSTITKFNFSRNSLSNNKNKTSSNFYLYKNCQISNNNSKDISGNNSISNQKVNLENLAQFGVNFLRKLSAKNTKRKVFSFKTCDKKVNDNIIHWLNLAQIKKRKIDFIKYKFLIGQKNYYKRLFQNDDFSFYSYYSKKINPSLKKNQNRNYFDYLDKIKKNFFAQDDINALSMKDGNKHFSISSLKDVINSHNKINNLGINNNSGLTIKKYNTPTFSKKSNKLFDNKNNILINKINLIEKSKENVEHKENKENKKINKSNKHIRIIDDNYKEYLKGISSSESNKTKRKTIYIAKKNNQVVNRSIKPLNNKLSLNDKSEIFQNMKKLNKYNYSNIIVKNNKKLFQLKKLISTGRKNLEDMSKEISKSIVIENPFIRKKIMLEKCALK